MTTARPAPQSEEGLPLGEAYPYGSPIALAFSNDGQTIFVAHHTGMRVDAIAVASGTTRWSTPLGNALSGIALDESREQLLVAHGLHDGHLTALHTANGNILASTPVGHTPTSPTLSPDARTVYLCNRFDDEVRAFDAQHLTATHSLKVDREPIAAAITPDGRTLVIAHHLPSQPATAPQVAARIDLIDTQIFTPGVSLLLPNGATAVKSVALSPDGQFAYITHTLARFHLPTTQVERGWMNTAGLSIIDLRTRALYATVTLDDPDLGAANPWGVSCSPDGKHLVVALSGTHEITVIDRIALHEKLHHTLSAPRPGAHNSAGTAIQGDLTFLAGIRTRIALPGKGPRALAVTPTTIAIAEYFSDSLALVALPVTAPPKIRSLPLAKPSQPSAIRRGELTFYNAETCFQQWQTCATCHPSTRVDGLNWDLLNDGLGNPKNTRNLLFSHETPPVMITGIRASAEVAVRAGFRFIQFTHVPEPTAADVDAYLRALRPIPSPHLVDGQPGPAALRGRDVFARAGCAHCHTGTYFTDVNKHDVGTGPDEKGIHTFVTPTLREIWRTAPYLFDGAAANLVDALTVFNPDDRHGRTSSLTDAELADLIAYLLTL